MKIIHINQHNIKHNAKTGEKDKPVISIKHIKNGTKTVIEKNQYSNGIVLLHDGIEVGRVVYQPDNPLSCGAKVWIETSLDIKDIEND